MFLGFLREHTSWPHIVIFFFVFTEIFLAFYLGLIRPNLAEKKHTLVEKKTWPNTHKFYRNQTADTKFPYHDKIVIFLRFEIFILSFRQGDQLVDILATAINYCQ